MAKIKKTTNTPKLHRGTPYQKKKKKLKKEKEKRKLLITNAREDMEGKVSPHPLLERTGTAEDGREGEALIHC